MENNEVIDPNTHISISNLHAHASIISRLGEELISDEITAFSELIKNCYDADSLTANFEIDCFYHGEEKVEFVDEKKETVVKSYKTTGRIILEDKGIGMDLKDIERGWLTISNSVKRDMKKNKIKTKRGRIPLGEKGLGRLSLQRLGRFSTLVTKKENSDIEYELQIPWLLYEKDLTLEDVKVKIACRKVKYDENGYTKIIISDLKNKELWQDDKKLKDFEKKLMQITSPFGRNYKFVISGNVNGRKINTELISKYVLGKRRSYYDIKLKDKNLSIEGSFGIEMFVRKGYIPSREEIDDFLKSKYFKQDNSFFMDNNLIKLRILYDDIVGIDGTYQINKYYPGDFEMKLYDFNLDPSYFKSFIYNSNISVLADVTSYKKVVKNYHGIYVIRDGFTILPYGFDGNDWLRISSSQNTSGSAYNLKNETVIGYVQLTAEENSELKEKTDREGFINNIYYLNFVTLIYKAINEINSKNVSLLRNFNEYKKNKEISSNNKRSPKTKNEAVKYIKAAVNDLKSNVLENEKHINQTSIFDSKEVINGKTREENQDNEKSLKEIENNILYLNRALEEQDERIEILTNLAGLGLVAESAAHDMMHVLANLESYTSMINNNIKQNSIINVIDILKYVNSLSQALRRQISHISPGFTVVRDKREIINVKEYFESFIEFYSQRAESKSIKLKLNVKEDFSININRGQLNQVFDNLYLNSEYWLCKYIDDKSIQNVQFNIEVYGDGIVRVWDNGYGISPARENDLFFPFITDKKDGRGLGLYIVKSILASNNSEIQLLNDRNSLNRRYILEICFDYMG